MRIRHGVAVFAATLLVSGCAFVADESDTRSTAAFCDAVADYAVAVLDLQSLDEQNTIDEFQAAAQTVEDAFDDVVEAAVVSAQAELAGLEEATDALVTTVRDLPEDIPVADIQAQLQQQMRDIAKARASLGVAVCSPAASAAPAQVPRRAALTASGRPASGGATWDRPCGRPRPVMVSPWPTTPWPPPPPVDLGGDLLVHRLGDDLVAFASAFRTSTTAVSSTIATMPDVPGDITSASRSASS